MNLDRVEPGDRLSAARENLLIEQVNALSRPGTPGQSQYGTSGVAFFGPPEALLALFELTGPVIYPDLSTAPSGHFDRDPTPHATAKRVWCYQRQTQDRTYAGAPIRSYAVPDDAREETVWLPLGRRNTDGYGVGPPPASAAARVLCLWNRQSGRWEVVQGPPYHVACWGQLSGQLNSGGSATVALWWGQGYPGINVTAHDWLLHGGNSLPSQTKVKVEYFPQDDKWWVTAAECYQSS
ncbi:MAG: hypothetical protein ABR915_09090 [Thermoguttaceae bacterium]|jgi:hypothetical protein